MLNRMKYYIEKRLFSSVPNWTDLSRKIIIRTKFYFIKIKTNLENYIFLSSRYENVKKANYNFKFLLFFLLLIFDHMYIKINQIIMNIHIL